jgi:hypothetical protein
MTLWDFGDGIQKVGYRLTGYKPWLVGGLEPWNFPGESMVNYYG